MSFAQIIRSFWRDLSNLGPSYLHNGISNTSKMAYLHYNDVIMSAMGYQITDVSTVCTTGCSGADQRKHQSSGLLAFAKGIHRWPLNSPQIGPLTRKIFSFHDVIMILYQDHVRNIPVLVSTPLKVFSLGPINTACPVQVRPTLKIGHRNKV